MSKHKPLVFLDVSIDGDPFERMIFELFIDVAPKTAENFRALCTGEKGESSRARRPLHYKGTFFHGIIKGSMAKAGDLLRQDGNYGESIYGEKFPDESPKLKHDGPGILSMAIADRDERGSLFILTFKAAHHLDRKCVVFGKLVHGYEVLKKIDNVGDEDGRPSVMVKIINCGELLGERKKLHNLKLGKDASTVTNSHEVQRKGKHMKSSKERRKKRMRHHSSESDSSSDEETESTESDSESDSYESTSTDDSSSSDDRRRKRKRSRRGKHRHGKKDRRREKRRKKRDKKSKRKTRRASYSLSGSENEGGSKDTKGDAQMDRNPKNLAERNVSPSVVEVEPASVREKRGESTDMFEREEGEFPQENGDPRSNGIGVENRSQKTADKEPDIVDDYPDKSRSRSISPKRTSKSMNISPKRSSSRSQSVSYKRSQSRSRSVSGIPRRESQRSRSITPVRSASSRSPARSISRSPVRAKRVTSVSPSSPVRARTQKSSSRSSSASPPRSPPRLSSRKPLWKSASRSPARSSQRNLSRSPVRPRRSVSRSALRQSQRSVSRGSGRAPSRRSRSRSSGKAPSRNTRRSYSRSPRGGSRRVRSPVSDHGRSSSRSPSVDGSSRRIRRGRGFSEQYSYARRYRSRSPNRSPVRSYRYGGRSDRDRYPSYRRSPRHYRSPPRGRTPPRYRGSRPRSRSVSRSPIPIRYGRRYSRSPVRSWSPVDRYRGSPRADRQRSHSRSRSPSESHGSPRAVRQRSPSRSRSPSESSLSLASQSPKRVSHKKSRSSSGSPPGKPGLVSYGDGSPDSGRD
ncbi:hypothetical protein ACH5RR_041027 [Cinchona calisaya]|uniref:peptidylprolyl isomerase n=1 Tax=Cinchona calisaya TaxID=153742 RepID=A0ABD2XXS6_9GENT